jgi:hypothetical protein
MMYSYCAAPHLTLPWTHDLLIGLGGGSLASPVFFWRALCQFWVLYQQASFLPTELFFLFILLYMNNCLDSLNHGLACARAFGILGSLYSLSNSHRSLMIFFFFGWPLLPIKCLWRNRVTCQIHTWRSSPYCQPPLHIYLFKDIVISFSFTSFPSFNISFLILSAL